MHRGPQQKVTQVFIDRSRTTIINNPITIINNPVTIINSPTTIVNHSPPEVKNLVVPVSVVNSASQVNPLNPVNSTSERVYTLIVAGSSQIASIGIAMGNYLWGQNRELVEENKELKFQNQQKEERLQVVEKEKKLAEIFKTDLLAVEVSKQGFLPVVKKDEK